MSDYRSIRGEKLITGIEDPDADFMSPGRSDLDFLELERLACTPADCGLALNGLSSSIRHGGGGSQRRGAHRRAGSGGPTQFAAGLILLSYR